MNELSVLSAIAGLLQFCGLAWYVYKIIRKQVRPAKATWIIWASLDVIAFAGMYHEGKVNGLITGATIGVLGVVVSAMIYGTSGWTRTDKICFGGTITAILSWWALDNAVFGIIVSLIAMCIGSIPTFISGWEKPDGENKLAWTIFAVSGLCAVIAIPQPTLADAAQPIVFLAIDLGVLSVVCIRIISRRTVEKVL